MAFDTAAPLAQLVTLLQGLSGMQSVNVGVPETLPAQVSAYVALGAQRVADKASSQLLQREMDYFVGFGYALDGAEAAAETALAALLDSFLAAVYAARRTKLGNTVDSIKAIDLSLANEPRYQIREGDEQRVFPVIVTVTQSTNY